MDLVNMGRGLRLLAWAVSVAMFMLWAAFFVEHLSWFVHSPLPPLRIWWAQGAHLLILAGLLAGLRWPLLGSALVVAGVGGFYLSADRPSAYAFFLITIAPAVLYFGAWLSDRRRVIR